MISDTPGRSARVAWLAVAVAALAAADSFSSGMGAYARRDYAGAVRDMQAHLAQAPGEDKRRAQAQSVLALSLFFQNDCKMAVPALERALEAGFGVTDVGYALGTCHLRMQSIAEARRAFARAFGVAADSPQAGALAASLMMRARMEDLAKRELDRIREAGMDAPEVHYLLGEIAIHRGDYESGIRELKQEIGKNPAFANAWYRLGDAYSRQARWEEASDALKKAVWLNPDFSSPYILLGKVYAQLDQPELASGVLEKAIAMDPNNAGARFQLGTLYRKLGRERDAERQFEAYRALQKSR